MKLTEREYDIASVAADLLMKGSPSTRIAKYCRRRKMTLSQVYKLLKAVPQIDPLGEVLRTFHRLEERPEVLDISEEHGKMVREILDNYGKTNKS